mgnify:CR=1 FL=1
MVDINTTADEQHVWLHSIDLSVTQQPIDLSRIVRRKFHEAILTQQYVLLVGKHMTFVLQWPGLQKEESAFAETKEKKLPNTYSKWRCWELPSSVSFLAATSSGSEEMLVEQSVNGVKTLISPHFANFRPRSRLVGVNACLHYCLAWDEQGRLYSWG